VKQLVALSLVLLSCSACQSSARARDATGGAPMDDEYFEGAYSPGFVDADPRPLSTFAIDVDTASYAHVKRYLERRRMPPASAVRIEELINAFPTGDPRPAGERALAVRAEVGTAPWTDLHRLVRIAITGRPVERAKRPDANLVFLLDVSGSMQDRDKLPLVKDAMLTLLDQLEPRDSVAVVTYRSAARVVLPATRLTERSRIEDAIGNLRADGWTNGGAGIELAYDVAQAAFVEGGVNRVILATDGDFNRGRKQTWELEQLIRKKARTGVYLTCLGVGEGDLNDANLETLADRGNGHYAYLRTRADAGRVLAQQLEQTLVAVARDVKVQVEFNPARVSSYRLIGYENRRLADRDFANAIADGGELGAGQSTVALYEVVPSSLSGPGLEPLRYGEGPPAGGSPELLTVKVRYVDAATGTHERIELPVQETGNRPSDDFRFTAGVAAFGMLLRGDPDSGACTYELVEELVGNRDPELRTLVRTASRLE